MAGQKTRHRKRGKIEKVRLFIFLATHLANPYVNNNNTLISIGCIITVQLYSPLWPYKSHNDDWYPIEAKWDAHGQSFLTSAFIKTVKS